ncbi:MAG: hypothetical protein WBN36_06435 [Gammaproteobacteria bacterium]
MNELQATPCVPGRACGMLQRGYRGAPVMIPYHADTLNHIDLARISHQAAWNTGKALVLWSETRMIKKTVCYSSMPHQAA